MKEMLHVLLAISILSIALPSNAELSYTFVRVDYGITTIDLDNVQDDLEGDTISFQGSVDIANTFAVIAGYATGTADVSGNGNTVELDADGYYVGGQLHFPVSDSADVFFGGRYIDDTGDFSLNGTFLETVEVDGFGLFIGVRGMATQQLELRGVIDRTDLEDQSGASETDTDIALAAGYYVTPTFSLEAGYSFDSDANTISFGVVKYF